MEVKRSLKISHEKVNKYNKMMAVTKLNYEKNDIPRFSTIEKWTVDFGNGYEMDLKVCSGNDGDPLWCEAVLFKNGSEVECSEVYDELTGQWELYDKNTFILEVSAE